MLRGENYICARRSRFLRPVKRVEKLHLAATRRDKVWLWLGLPPAAAFLLTLLTFYFLLLSLCIIVLREVNCDVS